ncbi:MAG: FAD-dependent oxidoreductase [Chitinivibrionales bacterium]|nr:FAD-dependent oxidoreductase [Chitinivibrionales bacterium]
MHIQQKKDCMTLDTGTYDAIVIGSGIGGLTAAAILAKLKKKRVLVLEKHFEPGGLTHGFRRGRFRWNVGLHYIGRMHKGELARAVFDFITDGKLEWRKIRSPFERFIYPDFTFQVSENRKTFTRDLCRRFPDETAAIKKYVRDVKAGARYIQLYYLTRFLPIPLSFLISFWSRLLKKNALQTTGYYLKKNIRNPRLAALLATQWGVYGAPPSESAFAIHGSIVNHYMNGAFVPEHSNGKISGLIEKVIRKAGGMVCVNCEVTEILIENNKAVGVKIRDQRTKSPKERIVHAPIIISSAGAENTYNRLCTHDHCEKKDINGLELGCSAVSLYVGLKESPEKLGLHGENIWINETYDHENLTSQTYALLKGAPHRCYVSFPSIRRNNAEHHNAEIIAMIEYAPFKKWAEQKWKRRQKEYYKLKEKIAAGLLDLVEKHLPGFTSMVEYKELSSPLTVENFTSRKNGAVYGFKPTAKYFRKHWYRVESPVKNIYLSGVDVCTVGVVGALMGGVAAASAVIGSLGFFRVIKKIRSSP